MQTTVTNPLKGFTLFALGLASRPWDSMWPAPQYAAAVERARERVRAAVLEQNLPGVSVAVGGGGTIVWAEGFGWRDVVTRTPVTPDTRHGGVRGLRPIGVSAPAQPLRGERATFYVPSSDDNPRRGRRPMYMRDLACCADGMAFYSTPSDLVRVALATNPGSVNGELAGGMVMSLMTKGEGGTVVAVTSNMAHAKTSSLALRVGDAFAEQRR